MHAQPADHQDHRDVDRLEQGRDDSQHLRQVAESLLAVDDFGLEPGPPRKKVRFSAGGFERLDRFQSVHCGADEFAAFLEQVAIGVHPAARDGAQRENVDRDNADSDQCQQHVILQHQQREEDGQHQVDDGGRQFAGQKLRDTVVNLHAEGNIARVTLREKLHRQVQNMPEEAARPTERELGFHAAAGTFAASRPDRW